MKRTQLIAAGVIVLLGLFVALGLWKTQQPPGSLNTGRQPGKPIVVLRPLKTAQQMAQLATSREERTFAQEALRLADYDVDLAFDEAIHETLRHPPKLSPEALAAKEKPG